MCMLIWSHGLYECAHPYGRLFKHVCSEKTKLFCGSTNTEQYMYAQWHKGEAETGRLCNVIHMSIQVYKYA